MSFARSGLSAEPLGAGSESLVGQPHKLHRVQPWQATGALIVAEVVGTGVLALGGSFAKLGWTLGIVVLTVGLIANVFTSRLLGYVACEFPDVVTFGDACRRMFGPISAKFGYGILYVYIFSCMANYIIVLSDAVRSVVYQWDVCRPWATLIGCVLLIPSNQLRTLTALTTLSIISFVTILLTIALSIYSLLYVGANCVGSADEPTFADLNAAMSTFIFAYAGQGIMLEMQAEMIEPKDFPKAVNLSFGMLFVVYLVVPSVIYSKCGLQSPGELLQVVSDGPIRLITGLLMVIHLIVTYTIVQQVLTRSMCSFYVPGGLAPGTAGHVKWFGVSTSLMVLAWILANSVPLFSDIVSITGALLSTQCAFTLPAVLFLALWKQGFLARRAPESQRTHGIMACCAVAVMFISVYCTITGTISSVVVMAKDLQSGAGAPFACKLDG